MGRRGRKDNEQSHGIIWGLALIAFGVLFLLSQQGILPRELMWNWWMYWPGVIILFGLVRLVRPKDASDVGGGVTMILIGLWLFSNWFEWWGLTWRTSWPLALVAVGAGMVARAIASGVMRDRSDAEVVGAVRIGFDKESSGKEEPRV